MNTSALFELGRKTIERHVPFTRTVEELEAEYFESWYATKDPSFYDEPAYLWLMLNCWKGWSNGNTKNAIKVGNESGRITKGTFVLDYGAGIGLTTIQLAQAFPEAEVIYQNLPGLQTTVAMEMFRELGLRNVIIDVDVDTEIEADFVVAFEVMEHIERPIELASKILGKCKTYVDASSFSIRSPGHFDVYFVGDEAVRHEHMKARYNRWLKSIGFREASEAGVIAKPFFNKRPYVWAR